MSINPDWANRAPSEFPRSQNIEAGGLGSDLLHSMGRSLTGRVHAESSVPLEIDNEMELGN
jgi:hypothetical protein